MRLRLALLALVSALLALAGCSSLDHGTVTGKSYQPGYWYTITICAVYGKYGCTVYMPLMEWNPECYQLDLRDGDDTGSTCVDEHTFGRLRRGEQYP